PFDPAPRPGAGRLRPRAPGRALVVGRPEGAHLSGLPARATPRLITGARSSRHHRNIASGPPGPMVGSATWLMSTPMYWHSDTSSCEWLLGADFPLMPLSTGGKMTWRPVLKYPPPLPDMNTCEGSGECELPSCSSLANTITVLSSMVPL